MFVPWHRPYLALFEQVLQLKAVEVAREYPAGGARDNALSLADKIRLPFWDWALNPKNGEPVLPKSIMRQKATITFPNGTSGEVPNPLYQYEFHPLKYEYFSLLVSNSLLFFGKNINSPIVRIWFHELEHNHSFARKWNRS